MDIQPLVVALLAHQWAIVATLVIGLLVRLGKDDTLGPVIPSRARPYVVLALGLLSGTLAAVLNHQPVIQALAEGLVSGACAILGHNVLIEGLRHGKEIAVPGLMKKVPPPIAPAAPPSVPPVVTTLFFLVSLASIFVPLHACKNAQSANLITGGLLSLEQVACVIAQAELGQNEPALVADACKVDPALIQEVVKQLEGVKRGKQMALVLAAARRKDGGVEAGSVEAGAVEAGK